MVPAPDAPNSGAVSTGSKANCWFLEFDQRHHVRKRRAGLQRDDQFVRLVGGDGVERRQVEHRIGRHRLPDLAPGAVADDLERLLGGNRRPHRLLDIAGVSYFQDVQTLAPFPYDCPAIPIAADLA